MPNDPAAPRIHDLPEPERKPFAEWLRGSAAPWIEGVPLGEQDAYYLHDYRRWKRAWGAPPAEPVGDDIQAALDEDRGER